MGTNPELPPQDSQDLTELTAPDVRPSRKVIPALLGKQRPADRARQSVTRALDDILAQRSGLMDRLKDT